MIKIRDLWKSFGKVEVLKGLTLDIRDNEILVILGRSGVGKSVLLKHILGIESADKGTIEFQDDQNSHPGAHTTKGMLFQNAALFDSMTVGSNTGFYLRHHPDPTKNEYLTPEEIEKRVEETLEKVNLGGTENKMPSDLSGGMKKRAALARMIIYRPRILLYDEPTAGLDPITAMQINDLIKQVQHDLKGTTVVVTHDIRSAVEIGDRLAFHHDGKIIHIAPKKDFFEIDDPLLNSFFENATLDPKQLREAG